MLLCNWTTKKIIGLSDKTRTKVKPQNYAMTTCVNKRYNNFKKEGSFDSVITCVEAKRLAKAMH